MANVAHSTLTTTNLHEPKGVASAATGQVYVANGSGSGAWTTVEGLTITGMIADFVTPIAPTGWQEMFGQTVSETVIPALYGVMTIKRTGSRTGGSAIITGLSSTTDLYPGYYVTGTGIAAGTTINSIDSSSQITLSANASSTGTSTVIVSPWLVGSGAVDNITFPNMNAEGRYRRSRTGPLKVGDYQAQSTLSHTHGFTTSANGSHSHNGGTSLDGNHTHPVSGGTVGGTLFAGNPPGGGTSPLNGSLITIGAAGSHSHTLSTDTVANHTHTGTTDANGGSEVRPTTLVVMTCVKL